MKQTSVILFFLGLIFSSVRAQQVFIPNGKINFEKKVNVQRSLADIDIPDEAKERMQKYNVSSWELYFNQSTSLYKPKKKETENTGMMFMFNSEASNELYADYSKSKRLMKKNYFGEDYLLHDTIPVLDWKIMHDVRTIAGYECRKAIGRINDTVYVVAFYTDEILLKGGPEGFSGLPGMILGLAIPRYNTTWFATKVDAFLTSDAEIVEPKAKKADTEKEMKKIIEIFGRYSGDKKQKPEDIKKQLYGFLL
ncbi:GLPGLI family protein [Pedobacter frigoris]|uniref:GLPGLI family protein n=1 Tax=Pedobacter frigoris TaxID=2571272 RepID=A0A4U1CLH6_9SPHI|nr:GLPGLI family protein [Pedobacter frigoris]TKC06030.1 GLPGLI family protein [Pedobacter frigoris]